MRNVFVYADKVVQEPFAGALWTPLSDVLYASDNAFGLATITTFNPVYGCTSITFTFTVGNIVQKLLGVNPIKGIGLTLKVSSSISQLLTISRTITGTTLGGYAIFCGTEHTNILDDFQYWPIDGKIKLGGSGNLFGMDLIYLNNFFKNPLHTMQFVLFGVGRLTSDVVIAGIDSIKFELYYDEPVTNIRHRAIRR